MRKSFVAMGLAAVLMAPAFLSAASKESTEAQAGPHISTHADITMVSKKTSKKAKAVINKIKAIKSQKADYIQKTKTAKSAYDKLSKKDKKLVANYSTLKKHWAKIQPALKKVKKLQADVTKLTDKNYRTKAAPLKKTYDSMNAITKAAVPASTVKKLNHYSNVTGSYRLMTLAVGNANSGTQEKNGPKIYNFLTSYNKLSGAQKNLLDHLMSSDEKSKLNGYLTQADTIKTAATLEKKYAILKTSSNTYGKDAVALYWEYTNATVADSEVAGFMPNSSKIVELQKIYEKQIVAAATFANLVDSIDEGSASKEELLKKIQDAVTSYKNISKPTASSTPNVYPKLAPIDVVDKKIIATYKKYETIPSIVEGILNLPDFIKVVPGSLTSAQIDNLIDQLAKYKKLGADQKEIVQANAQEKKPYLLEEKNVASAQTIDKSYDSVQKKKTSPTYLADLQKVFDAYDNSIIDVRRFIKNALTIAAIPTSPVYKEAKIAADDFAIDVNKLSANSTLQDVKSVVAKYNTMSNAKPNQTALVDKIVLKTYNQYAGIPQVVTAFNKIPDKTLSNGYYGYSTKNITDLLSNIKTYKKLGTPQKAIVDNSTTTHKPTIEMLAGEEANIKEAQGLDKAYAKLKKSSKNYPKEAKKVHIDYLDASPDTLKYLVNGLKMEGLDQAYKSQQQLASTFEEMVNQLNRKSNATQDVLPVVRYYLAKVEPYSKISNLVDSKILKKYKQYEPIADIMQMFDLIKITNENDISPTNIEYIQQAIKTYKKLAADPKKVIDDADRSKYKFLQDGDEIAQAATIDKAFEKIKPTDSKYEVDVLKVYYTLYDRAPSQVKKYVANKKALEEVATRYIPQLATAREFEQMVKDLSEVSNKGYTPGVQDVKKVKDYYVNNVKYNKINAQYNVPLETIIDPTIMEQYHKFEDILTIQDIAKSMYVQYGRFVEGKGYASGDKLKNKNDVNSIVKVITLYNQLDSPQRAIVSKAPRYANDHSYEESHNIPYDPNRVFEENEIIRPSIPLNDVAIQNFLEAQKINAAYEALKPSSSSYRDGAIALYYRYMNAGPNVQAYVIYSKEIEDFANRFNAATIKAEIDAFIQALNKLSKNSLYEDVNSVVKQYNALNEVQLSLLDKPTLAKYNSYAPLVDMYINIDKINKNGKYSNNDIQLMLSTIAIYKKISLDPKAIVTKTTSLNKEFLTEETAIKQAQKLDKSYQSLDPNSKKYGTDLKKIIQDYDKLSTTAKKYVVTDFDSIQSGTEYKTPKEKADAFEKAVNRLSPKSPYADILEAVKLYNGLDKKALTYVDSKVLAIYNKYAPIVSIVTILTDPGTPYDNQYIDNIAQAITLYNKLGKDQKAIAEEALTVPQKALLNEGDNIKAAQELDKKIVAITPGKSGYTKAVIEAGKTYDAMSVNAQNYVKNKSKLREYRTDKNIEPSIKKLADFEKGVAEVEELAADETNNNCGTGTCSKDIVDKMVILERLYQDLNIPKLIKGEEIKLSTLIDRKVLQRYQYFYAVYDIKNQLDNL